MSSDSKSMSASAPMVQNGYALPGSEAMSKVKELYSGMWMSPIQIVVAALVGAVLIALVYYYEMANLLTITSSTCIFGTTANWVTTGGGIMFFFFVALLIGSSAASLGLAFPSNNGSLGAIALVTIVLGLLFWYVFASARDDTRATNPRADGKTQFLLWSFLALIVSLGVPIYAYMGMSANMKKLKENPTEFKEEEKKNLPKRNTFTMAMLGVSVIDAIIVAAGLWKIYGVLV